jgi:hypothetical protein
MAVVPDAIAALVAFLKADSAVASATGGRVYGVTLPQGQASAMPRSAVVLTASGSGGNDPGARSYAEVGAQRVDVRCYGATALDASGVHGAVYGALKQLRRARYADVTLYRANVETRGIHMQDADGDWPLVLSVWDVLVSEQAVATP